MPQTDEYHWRKLDLQTLKGHLVVGQEQNVFAGTIESLELHTDGSAILTPSNLYMLAGKEWVAIKNPANWHNDEGCQLKEHDKFRNFLVWPIPYIGTIFIQKGTDVAAGLAELRLPPCSFAKDM